MSNGDIIVLEDEALIAIDIEMTLAEAGYENVLVCSDSQSALSKINGYKISAALLDYNLGNGQTSLLVAKNLRERCVPFVFLTGYTDVTVSLPDGLSDIRRIAKPFRSAELVDAVNEMVSCI